MNTDIVWVLYDVRNLFKTQLIFFVRNKIFPVTFRMFDSIAPEENVHIRRKAILKLRKVFEDGIHNILAYCPDRYKIEIIGKNVGI